MGCSMILRSLIIIFVFSIFTCFSALAQNARDQIRVVGSSTVFPFTTTVAETFNRSTGSKAPIVESTGTGGGFRLFCGGIGTQHPDISNASRPITKSEIELCAKNGVNEITEIMIGYDGIVLAVRKDVKTFNITREEIWLALARQIPKDGKLINNPYMKWSDINPKLPNTNIEVMGPPPTSGTRDAFVEMVMDYGCKSFPEINAITDPRMKQQACASIREDGKFIEAGENDNLIVQRLFSNKNMILGIFGYSFLEENMDKISGLNVDGHEPIFENISSLKYPVARSLFVYIKNAHVSVIPGIKEFVQEYVSERAMGDGGYLEKKGLVPLLKTDREKVRRDAIALTPMK